MSLERFLLKKRLLELQQYQGSSTSMVSLYIRGSYQISLVSKMLIDEQGKAENIKDRVNRGSVQDAITSAIERLRGMNKAPVNGLCLFSGSVMLADGRTKRVVYLFEPPKEVGTFYKCDKQFHVDQLLSQLEDDRRFGFIIIDGNGALYGTLSGSAKKVLYKFEVELQGKNKAGGQSSLRFSRLRREQRYNYERKAAEQANKTFMENDRPNVQGLFIAGSAEFKTVFSASEFLDARLRAIILGVLDVQYGMNSGFDHAITQSGPLLGNLKLVEEAKAVTAWMTEIAQSNDKIIFGVNETLEAYDEGVMEHLLVWDQLPYNRYVIESDTVQQIKYLKDHPTLETRERIVDEQPLVDWLIENPKKGVQLSLISDCTSQGSQFSKGFGGLGGYLQYPWKSESDATTDEGFDDSF